MPISIEIEDSIATSADLEHVFNYFRTIDERFSPFKAESEVTRFNKKQIQKPDISDDLKTIFRLSEQTKQETDGYFDIYFNGVCNPSGLVKGWAINNAVNLVRKMGFQYYCVEAGGDIQVSKSKLDGEPWRVGIRNPFNKKEIVKVVELRDCGIATSGTYERGRHIYNPKTGEPADEIVSLSVIGPNIYEADRFATAAFAMGQNGAKFISGLKGFEAYQIDKNGLATFTNGFNNL
jgi:thiamine biosynthesis lipoprotein